jgi:Zn ribbon nucleic-acid-binding protein
MRIKEIISQSRRDFVAIYECEHCGYTAERGGYDDNFFHAKVIPTMECVKCGKTASSEYIALKPKYEEGYQL